MTVSEVMDLVKDEYMSVIVYDNDTKKILSLELDGLSNATVNEISSDGKVLKVFVSCPAQKYYTYLDITYSTRIELDVPVGADERELLKKEAEKLMGYMPDGLCINGHSFSYDYDNIQSGGFEDMIEKC